MPHFSRNKTRLTFSDGLENLMFVPAFGIISLVAAGLIAWEQGRIDVAVIPFLIGATFLAMRTGVQVDTSKHKIRRYFGVWGVRMGFWKNLNRYADILMLQQIRSTGYGELVAAGNQTGTKDTKGISEIYLANHNHLHRFLIRIYYRNRKADAAVKALADATGFPYVRYNPANRRPREVYYTPGQG
ncbi:MAG: hypothetical protein AAFV07_07915 [Bacteroidota bacterium]